MPSAHGSLRLRNPGIPLAAIAVMLTGLLFASGLGSAWIRSGVVPMRSEASARVQLAALINAYHHIIRRSAPRRPTWWGFVSYFFIEHHAVLGHSWSLWQLEQEIRSFGDPRVHFALNCGAASCPPIRTYEPEALDRQLELATSSFLSSDQAVRIDVRHRTLYLSALFQWYRGDFGDPVRFVARYLPSAQLALLHQLGPSPRIRFLPWDWKPTLTE